MKIVSGEFDLPELNPKGPLKIMQTYIKYYPVEYHAQSAVQAALNLRGKLPQIDPGQIERIEIRTSDISYEIIGSDPDKWQPLSRETADHSLPYIVAVALMDGKVGLPQFNSRHLNNPVLQSLIQKVRVFADKSHSAAYPEAIGNRVSVKVLGKTYVESIDYPKGFPKNKMSDAEIEAKFVRMAKPLLSKTVIQDILGTIWRLETLSSVGTLLPLFHVKDKSTR